MFSLRVSRVVTRQGIWSGAPTARFASNNRQQSRRAGRAVNPLQQNNTSEEMPQFAGLLRQFYKQTHPDILRASNSEYADINDQSWKTLNGILSTIKEVNSYPPQMVKTIPFHMRSSTSSTGFKQVDLRIRTAGGDCKKQLTVTMQNFFVESEISADGKFQWGKDYFPLETAGVVVSTEL